MPFCPNCKVEYRPGFTRCTDCDVELVESLASDDNANVDWVDAGALPNPEFAGVVKEMMADAGIPCSFHGNVGEGVMGSISGHSQNVKVLVPSNHLTAAKELLHAYFESEYFSDDAEFLSCSSCGAAVDEEDEVCPACGEKLEKDFEK